MSEEPSFRLTKGYIINRTASFDACAQDILNKPVFLEATHLLVIEDVTNNQLLFFPVPSDKILIVVQLETTTRMEMDEMLGVLSLQLRRLGFEAAFFDSGICPRTEHCRWKGFFWADQEQMDKLATVQEQMLPHKMDYEIMEPP